MTPWNGLLKSLALSPLRSHWFPAIQFPFDAKRCFLRGATKLCVDPLGTKLAAIRETGPTQLAQRFAVSFLPFRNGLINDYRYSCCGRPYSARIASPTPIASHRPTASPTTSHLPLSLMVILPARQLGQHHRSVPPRRFSRPTREAASCVPLRTDRGSLSLPLPFPERIKALDVMSTYSRDWSRMRTKAICPVGDQRLRKAGAV